MNGVGTSNALMGTAAFEAKAAQAQRQEKVGTSTSLMSGKMDIVGQFKRLEAQRLSKETNDLKPMARGVESRFENQGNDTRERLRKLKGADDFVHETPAAEADGGTGVGRVHGDQILDRFLEMKNDTRLLQTYLREEVLPTRTFKIEYGPDKNAAEAASQYYQQLENPLVKFEEQFSKFANVVSLEQQVETVLNLNVTRETILSRLCNMLMMEIGGDAILQQNTGDSDDDHNYNNDDDNGRSDDAGNKKKKDKKKTTAAKKKRDWDKERLSMGTKALIKCFVAARLIGEKSKSMERLLQHAENSGNPEAKKVQRELRDEITGLEEQLRQTKALLVMKGEHLEAITAKYDVLANEPGRLQNLSRQQDQIDILERNQMELSREISKLREENRSLKQSQGDLTDRNTSLQATLKHERSVFEQDVDSLRPAIQRQLEELRTGRRDMAYIRHGLSLTIDRFNLAESKLANSEKRCAVAESQFKAQAQELEMLRMSNAKIVEESSRRMRIALVAVAATEKEEAYSASLKEKIAMLEADKIELNNIIKSRNAEINSLKRTQGNMAANALKSKQEIEALKKEIAAMTAELAIAANDLKAMEALVKKREQDLADMLISQQAGGQEAVEDTMLAQLDAAHREVEDAKLEIKRLEHQLKMAMHQIYEQSQKIKEYEKDVSGSEDEDEDEDEGDDEKSKAPSTSEKGPAALEDSVSLNEQNSS